LNQSRWHVENWIAAEIVARAFVQSCGLSIKTIGLELFFSSTFSLQTQVSKMSREMSPAPASRRRLCDRSAGPRVGGRCPDRSDHLDADDVAVTAHAPVTTLVRSTLAILARDRLFPFEPATSLRAQRVTVATSKAIDQLSAILSLMYSPSGSDDSSTKRSIGD
jgi:hypothetical protein